MSLLMLFVCQGVRLLCLLDCSIILELMQIATIIGHEVYPLYTCLYCQSQIVVYNAGFL
jgi:hypothetical protein